MGIQDFFHPIVSEWFSRRFGKPSPPQQQGWPAIAGGRHTLILAPTGSGKTLAAFLWCIDELFRNSLAADPAEFHRNRQGIHTLYISPLKALNNDIHRNLQEPLAGIYAAAADHDLAPAPIRVAVRTGDTLPSQRAAMLRKPPHILITTPESLFLLLTSEKGRELFAHLRYVIVDEIHALSNNKRGVHLSLTLERLMALCPQEPVRIGLSATQKPLQRIARYLGGQSIDVESGTVRERPVTILDCGQRREMDVRVIAPVADYGDLPEASIWPAVYEKLYELIASHKSTLVFVNMRAQSEKIARRLNDLFREKTGQTDAILALAHHGSLSRETRYDIESRLKEGKIPAVIATASLELGIDIGSIDLVVQLGAPRTVSSALQRVGRSGHLLSATSKGRIIPLYPADIDDCLAITAAMKKNDIEETRVPENCLDVLAQQVVAEVAMKTWPRSELYHLIRQSYCYERLTPAAFDQVLAMLCGDFSTDSLRGMQPRITWDRVNDRLIARRGSRLMAVMNMGTIPDRAYYGVYLVDAPVKLGEVEEEFVFESRIGDHFFLGNQVWRIVAIDRNQIKVTPVAAANPKPPFWKGDSLLRDYSTSEKIGEMRRRLETPGEKEAAAEELSRIADAEILNSLLRYFSRQKSQTGGLATNRVHVGECFTDAAGQFYLVWHAPAGARVTGLLALSFAAQLQNRFQVELQYSFDDDGFALRFPEKMDPVPVREFLETPMENLKAIIVSALVDSPTFAVQFRQIAARALMLPRSQPRKRIPLWLQRLRAADLLQAVRNIPDFPLLLETYRECLQDVFDWVSFQDVVERLKNGTISFRLVQTPSPSAMASGLLFRFLANNMYEADRTRLPYQAAAMGGNLLAEIMAQGEIPRLVTREMAQEKESRWQHLSPTSQAGDAEDLYAMMRQLGPMMEKDLSSRCRENPLPWLAQLARDGRIRLLSGQGRWEVVDDAAGQTGMDDAFDLSRQLSKYLASHGPVSELAIARDLEITEESIRPTLEALAAQGKVVSGKLLQDIDEACWCDRENFAELYRTAIAQRRQATRPLSADEFYRFMFAWHKIASVNGETANILRQYRALASPLYFLSTDMARVRLDKEAFSRFPQQVAELVRSGDFVLRAKREKLGGRLEIDWIGRGEGGFFTTPEELSLAASTLSEIARQIWNFLRENGASFFRDICDACSLTGGRVQLGLKELCEAGLASCDEVTAFEQIVESAPAPEHEELITGFSSGQRKDKTLILRPPMATRQRIKKQLHLHQGRWFLLTAFSVMGQVRAEERTEFQARLLLQRYGILVKEWYRREKELLSWHVLFQALKRMEWRGEIQRGYFLQGVSGIQFALPEAVRLIEAVRQTGAFRLGEAILMSTLDPSLPFGGAVPWPGIPGRGGENLVVRHPGNFILFFHAQPCAYVENHGRRIHFLQNATKDAADSLCQSLREFLRLPVSIRPRSRITIESIDGYAASDHRWAASFVDNGFEADGKKLILWPSRL